MHGYQTPEFDAMVAPARRHPQIWRLLVGLVLATLIYAGFVGLMIGGAWLLGGVAALDHLLYGFTGDGDAVQTLWLMLTFAGMALGAFVAARALQKRGPATLFGPGARRFGRDFLRVFVIVFALLGGSVLLSLGLYAPVPNLPLAEWLVLLAPALVLLFVQVTAEELVFRGYIQTQLAARFASPAIWLVLPAVLFGFAHYNPAEAGANAWHIVGAALLYGLIAGDLTARTGSLGAAVGFHLANNIFAILIIAVDGTITGLGLYLTPFTADQAEVMRPMMIQDTVVMCLAWAICRIVLRR